MDIWQLNLRHLKAVAKIAELGGVNAAARAVNLSQPAITQALGRLEAELGLELFERYHNGMVPTDAVELLVPRIEAALDYVGSSHVTMARMRAMLALADAGSYAGASQLTGLALPSIHRAVNDLAMSMRRKLVERRGKIILLTEVGNQLARAFRLARVELEVGLAEIEALKGHETRRIAIGAMPLSRARVLPAAAVRFLRRHPQVQLSILEGSRGELVELLRGGVIDLMVGALREPLLEPEFEQEALFENQPVVIARKGHPLAGTAPDVAALARYPWAVPAPGAPLRDSFERFFSEAGIGRPAVPVESGSVMMIRQILMHSDFLTMLSPDQLAVELAADWLARIADLPAGFIRTIGITTRLSWRATGLQNEFLSDLRVAAGEMPTVNGNGALGAG